MAEIKVRAADSSLAMDEVQKRLGDDALIISTSKKDGQIEIIATNDDLTLKQNKSEPLILGEAYKSDKFERILRNKVDNPSPEDLNYSDFQIALRDRLDSLMSDVSGINSLIYNGMPSFDPGINLLSQLQMIGFRKKSLQDIGINDNEISSEVATKKIAKAFVSGKSSKFENSHIYLIVGDRQVGKSIFAEKFLDLMINTNMERDFELVQEYKPKKLDGLIRDLLKTIDSEGSSQKSLILDLGAKNSSSSEVFKNIVSQKQSLNVSVIRVLEVGKSYEFLIKSPRYQAVFPEYIAFSKLDLCDLSVPEISAMLEIKSQCMFLSGKDEAREGLYFAKVDQVGSFLLNKFRDEHG